MVTGERGIKISTICVWAWSLENGVTKKPSKTPNLNMVTGERGMKITIFAWAWPLENGVIKKSYLKPLTSTSSLENVVLN
jgi:hypothetical protein